ncbi:hypothetical protein EI555_017853, partial [Monodon monoceros]
YPIYGVPTIRSDIPAPQIRRISDRTNYGEEGNAYSLLYPTIFGQKGLFERDFFKTRSKKEVQHIAEILCKIGVKLSEDEFENVNVQLLECCSEAQSFQHLDFFKQFVRVKVPGRQIEKALVEKALSSHPGGYVAIQHNVLNSMRDSFVANVHFESLATLLLPFNRLEGKGRKLEECLFRDRKGAVQRRTWKTIEDLSSVQLLSANCISISFDLVETHQQEINFPLEAENKVIYCYFSSFEINSPLVHILMCGSRLENEWQVLPNTETFLKAPRLALTVDNGLLWRFSGICISAEGSWTSLPVTARDPKDAQNPGRFSRLKELMAPWPKLPSSDLLGRTRCKDVSEEEQTEDERVAEMDCRGISVTQAEGKKAFGTCWEVCISYHFNLMTHKEFSPRVYGYNGSRFACKTRYYVIVVCEVMLNVFHKFVSIFWVKVQHFKESFEDDALEITEEYSLPPISMVQMEKIFSASVLAETFPNPTLHLSLLLILNEKFMEKKGQQTEGEAAVKSNCLQKKRVMVDSYISFDPQLNFQSRSLSNIQHKFTEPLTVHQTPVIQCLYAEFHFYDYDLYPATYGNHHQLPEKHDRHEETCPRRDHYQNTTDRFLPILISDPVQDLSRHRVMQFLESRMDATTLLHDFCSGKSSKLTEAIRTVDYGETLSHLGVGEDEVAICRPTRRRQQDLALVRRGPLQTLKHQPAALVVLDVSADLAHHTGVPKEIEVIILNPKELSHLQQDLLGIARREEEGRSAIKEVVTREYTINIHKRIPGVPFKKRAPRALKEIQKFARKEMGTPDVRVDTGLNKAGVILQYNTGLIDILHVGICIQAALKLAELEKKSRRRACNKTSELQNAHNKTQSTLKAELFHFMLMALQYQTSTNDIAQGLPNIKISYQLQQVTSVARAIPEDPALKALDHNPKEPLLQAIRLHFDQNRSRPRRALLSWDTQA